MNPYEIIWIIVDFGNASKIVRYAMKQGINGATIFLGKGTINNYFLKLLDITDVRKEVIMMVAHKDVVDRVLPELDKKFQFEKPHHGIAFTMSVNSVYGIRKDSSTEDVKEEGGKSMHKAIFVVVDRGKAEYVLDSAIAAGAKGATIINARGSGIHEQKVLFSFPIEPEKEILLIIAENETAENIIDAIRRDHKIDEPGRGILFVLDVNKTFGLTR